jgi:tRNA/tmRNA/rRNA uracil-C5-methylase (TrmA/RlmC/RlmD family)
MKKKKRIIQALATRNRDGAVPLCRHFGECGGCLFQDISYENQLALKAEYLRGELDCVCDVGPVRPSRPSGTGADGHGDAFGKAGLRKRGSYRRVVDIESCDIMQQRSNEVFRSLRPSFPKRRLRLSRAPGIPALRGAPPGMYTGQLMLNFVVASRENRLAGVIDALPEGIDSVSLLLSDGRADVSFGEVFETVRGGSIEERLGDLRFSIAPNSFFQSNSSIALPMYEGIRSMVKGRTLDLYSGVGSISLFVASAAESVTGVEVNPRASPWPGATAN